jgi:phosphohistidine phosphatase
LQCYTLDFWAAYEISLFRTMTTPPINNEEFTTNDEDQNEVAKLQARLKENNSAAKTWNAGASITRERPLPSVEIADGVHKYVLIKAEWDGEEQYIVTSKKGAAYHRNAAEPMISKLQNAGYDNIEVTGGGRISLDSTTKQIHIYGFSYGFGLADHSISQSTILDDPRYTSFKVTYSNDGY